MNKKGHLIGSCGLTLTLLLVAIMVVIITGGFDKHCDYQFKEQFEIEEFEVSASGFLSPDLVNIRTVDGKNKVISLGQVYSSVSEINEGDIIECEELEYYKIYCSAKVKCQKVN